jgi:hypothetical protein
MNNREWSDQDLSNPREEWGTINTQTVGEVRYQEGVHYGTQGIEIREEQAKVEAIPTNQSPGHLNSEHWYNEHGNIPLGYGRQQTSGSHKSSEEYYSEGFVEKGGPSINGKTPSELIASGLLSAENIKPEDKQVVYEDILLGLTNNKDILAKKIDLIISDKTMINNIISNQYILAVQEMKKEAKGFVDNTPTNRKFQFLTTTKILMEKGYDISSLSFKKGENQIGLAKLVSDFRKECAEHNAKNIQDPSWFKSGQTPENYDMRKVNNPWLFSGVLITEIYLNNPQTFEAEYEKYKATTKMPSAQILSYEEFIHYAYGIEVPAKKNTLELFKEARERQMQQDKIVREQQLVGLTQKIIETKEGRNLR